MEILLWLVPPLAAMALAMLWAAWQGRARDEIVRDDSDAALERMRKAIAKPAPQKKRSVPARALEKTHGVAVRRVDPGTTSQQRRAG